MTLETLKFGQFVAVSWRIVAIATLAGWTVTSNAQTAPAGPPPGFPLGSPLPGIVPRAPPNVGPGLPAPPSQPAPPPAQSEQTFAIQTISVDGVTAFANSAIEPITRGLTGPTVSGDQIETGRRAIVDLYRSNGYVFTTVRAVIRGSDVRFSVIEGYIAEVKLDSDVGPVGTQVLRFLDHLVGLRPLRTKDLERWLLLASDIPGLTIKSTLNPSLGDPGALTLIATVSHKVISFYISADNRAPNFNGPEQGIAALDIDSLTEFGERTQLSFYAAPGPNVFGQASEEFFVGGSGLKFRIYAGAGPAFPTGSLKNEGYNTMTRVFGGQFAYPVIRQREQTLNLTLAFDGVETEADTNLGPNGTSLRGSYDSLRILRIGTDYALFDTLLGADRSATNALSIRLSQGLPILGSGHDGDNTTPPARLGERVDFTKVNGELTRTQTLFQPFRDATVALRASLDWQVSNVLLPPVEKFYLGGPHFNSGYYYGEVSGDEAVTTSLELQLNTPLPVPEKLPLSPLQAQFYLFYDWGDAWQNTRLENDVTLQSLGGGVRLSVNTNTDIDLEGVYRGNLYPNGNTNPGLSAAAFYWQIAFHY
jgi:hemolysin activation/secretion protein